MKLYRISVGVKRWVKTKPKPFYIIAKTKEEAIDYLKKNLIDDAYIIKCIELGEQLSGIMYRGKS